MPDSSDRYQLPSWPVTIFNRDLWNSVFGDIADRLTAREGLEASFEALQAQGIQASLDYVQATVAPQIATLQTSITLAQEQIDQIVIDGISPNSLKLGGQLPAYYATSAALTAGLASSVPNTRTVAGKPLSADVILVKADVGLGNVDNTSDIDKPVSIAQAAALATSAAKNLLINPLFRIDQNGAAGGTGNAGGMCVDGWGLGSHTNSVATISRIAGATVPYALQLNTAAVHAQTALQHGLIWTAIEGYDVASAMWGTAAARPIAIAFSARATVVGTYTLAIRNAATNRSYLIPVQITAANILQHFEFTVPGDTAGVWNSTNGVGLHMSLAACAGATYQSPTPNAWLAGNFLGLSTQTNAMATVNNKLIIENPRLSIGDKAIATEHVPMGQELARCYRYEVHIYHGLMLPVPGNGLYNFRFPIEMRTVPTVQPIEAGNIDGAAIASDGSGMTTLGGWFQIQALTNNGNVWNRRVRYAARLF